MKVGSRRVVQYSAVFMIVFAVFTKFGALFLTIPDPVIGGAFFVLFGMSVVLNLLIFIQQFCYNMHAAVLIVKNKPCDCVTSAV